MADPTMNRQSGGLDLTPETQAQIWQTAAYQSAFMQLVPQINLPGKGVRVPIITGDPVADWVQEGAEKPKSGVGFSKKDMVPYTIAVILPFSNQFRRDFDALYAQIIAKGPGAIARKIDQTIMGLGDVPGADFDTLAGAPQVQLGKTVWKSLNDADDSVTNADGTVDGWALSPQGRSILRQTTNNNGRPLFLNGTSGSDVSTVLGNRTYISKGVHVPAQAAGENNNPPARPEIVGVDADFADSDVGLMRAGLTFNEIQSFRAHQQRLKAQWNIEALKARTLQPQQQQSEVTANGDSTEQPAGRPGPAETAGAGAEGLSGQSR